jgi:hypothetical protein
MILLLSLFGRCFARYFVAFLGFVFVYIKSDGKVGGGADGTVLQQEMDQVLGNARALHDLQNILKTLDSLGPYHKAGQPVGAQSVEVAGGLDTGLQRDHLLTRKRLHHP